MKQFTIWLFLFAVFTADFSRLSVYVGFELNRDVITSKLCENRDKPWMHCNGKCYLMKKVKEAEQNENNNTTKNNLNRLQVSFFQQQKALLFQPVLLSTEQQKTFANYTFKYSSQYINTIFRPPKNLV